MGKLTCTVLRGLEGDNALRLLGVFADSSATISVSGTQMGISTQYIGANSGTSYDSGKFKDVGFNSMRIWDDITEFEPQNDSSTYGSPGIDQIKNDTNISSSGLIPWSTWDNNFSSYQGFFDQIKNDNIRLMISLRDTGNNHGQGWLKNQPPATSADWNEWWEHVFAEVYWLNVRNNYHVDDWEVFNEPDNSGQGWNGTTAQYETFVQYTSDAIRNVYSRFLPGRTPYIYTSALSYPQAPANGASGNWQDNVFSTVGNDFNALSYHYYHSGAEFSNGINIAHSQANNAGHSDYPVWITEWGSYDETSSQQGIDPNCDSNEPCAVRMIDDMILGSQPGNHYLTGSEYYVWGPGSYGDSILDGNSNPRTVYYALRLGIRALQAGKPTYQSSTSTSDLDSITTKDSSGNIYLLTTNTSGTSYTVNEDLSALYAGSASTTMYRYDGSNADSSASGPAISSGHVSFSIPANGAVLLAFNSNGNSGTALDRTGWVASASIANTAEWPSRALDGDLTTRYSTGTSQTNGQSFQVDMQTQQTFSKIVLDATNSPNDYPRGYAVYVSNDGSNWGSAVATGAGSGAVTTITFSSQTARYIKVVQTASTGWWWSIDEFNVYP